MKITSRLSGLLIIALTASACLTCLCFTGQAQASYEDPPVKIGTESEHIVDTSGFTNENSPRQVEMTNSAVAEQEYADETASSADFDAAVSTELRSEAESLVADTGIFDWELLPTLAVGVGGGWAGWEIGSAIRGIFFNEAAPTVNYYIAYPATEWIIDPPEDMVLSEGAGDLYTPNSWGMTAMNQEWLNYGEITDTGNCEMELYGDGKRIYAPGWEPSEGGPCEITKTRDYKLWKPLTIERCEGEESCPGIEPVPDNLEGQPKLPTEKQLKERVEAELGTTGYPVINRFLNHETQPENFPDPRITKKKVDEEERRCDRGTPSFENPGGNGSPEPFAKKEESAFTIASLPEGVGSPSPVYLRWGATSWLPGTEEFSETPYLDLWGGWGYRHILAKHGWNALDREETELALSTPQVPKKEAADLYRYSAIDPTEGSGSVECERRVLVAFETGTNPKTEEKDPAPRGVVTSFNAVK